MFTVSNGIIEEAMQKVKDDCSSENIQHLAATIKKYRPESVDNKKTYN